jgi:RNA polymerase sigma-70 factor (ECF subfamily)
VQAAPQPDRDVALQRRVVDAFLAAARAGDFEALVQVLDPDVVFRMDLGPGSAPRPPLAGSGAVAGHVLRTAPRFVNLARPVLVNGEAGALFGAHDDPVAVIGFTIAGGRIAELNLVADPGKLRHLTIEP